MSSLTRVSFLTVVNRYPYPTLSDAEKLRSANTISPMATLLSSSLSSILNNPHCALRLKFQRPSCFTLGFLNWGPEKSGSRCYHRRQQLQPRPQRRSLGRSSSRSFSNSSPNASSLSGQSGGPGLRHFVAQAALAGAEAQPQ